MKTYIYNAILGTLALFILILPFTGKVHDGRRKNWLKGFTIRGWLVCVIFLATIVVNYFKDIQVDKNENKKALEAKNEKRKDDSISRIRNDESNSKIVMTFTTALAKYNLKYDSTQKVVLKVVRDSSKKSVTIKTIEEPDLCLHSVTFNNNDNNVYYFKLTMLSKKSRSEHIYIKLYTVDEENGQYHFLTGSNDFFSKNGTLGANEYFNFNINFTTKSPPSAYYFLLIGTYKDIDGKQLTLNRVYSYDFEQKSIGIPLEPYYTKISDFFHENGITF